MYKIEFDESVLIFFRENNINLNGISKRITKMICDFSRSKPTFYNNDLLRIAYIDKFKLLYYVVEILNRKPLSERSMEIGQQIGLALMLMLMAFAFFNDINRLIFG